MRDYAKVAPQFWTGSTGKALKAAGPEAVIVGLYLMTSPHANMIGVYHCPLAYIAFDTGLGIEGASKGLQSCIDAGFCTFEASTDYVFVHEFAAYQIGDELDAKDLRCKGVRNELAKVPKGQCWQGFRARYAVPFNLPLEPAQAVPAQAPSKPLQSQEQEQEKEQEQEQETKTARKRATASQSVSVRDLMAEGVEQQHAADWIAARRVKHLPLTPTAWEATKAEVLKAGMTVPEAIRLAAENGWGGFKAKWVDGSGGRALPVGKQSAIESRNAAVVAKLIQEQSYEVE